MNLRKIPNESLWSRTHELVQRERAVTLELLWHLRELEFRGLHLDRGFNSLFDYCTRELGYSAGAAQRRIESMRLLREVPEVGAKIQSGELNLSTVSLVQGFLKNERKQERVYTVEKKRELVLEFCGKSKTEVERALLELAPESVPLKKESQRMITKTLTEIRFLADDELVGLLEQVKDLMGGKNAYPDLASALKVIAKAYIAKKTPSKSVRETPPAERNVQERQGEAPGEVAQSVETRVPNTAMRRCLNRRAEERCEFVDKKTGRRCEARRNLEVDHIRSWSSGGKTELSNLQLLCHQHHRHKTELEFGAWA